MENIELYLGSRFKPTFESNILYFKVRGYDKEREIVLTTVFPKGGKPFDDEIELRYLRGAFETGEYERIRDAYEQEQIYNFYLNPYFPFLRNKKPLDVMFTGPCCSRCKHRFGNTSNREWCATHYGNEKCYRFKL